MGLVTGTYEVVSDKAKDNQVTGRISLVGSDGNPIDIAVLPATATAAELAAGTVTDTRLVTPKLVHDEIARQIAAIPAA